MIWYQIKADISINITIIGRAILIWFVFQSAVPQFFRVIMDEESYIMHSLRKTVCQVWPHEYIAFFSERINLNNAAYSLTP